MGVDRDPRRVLARVIRAQNGVLTREQLHAAGLTPDAIKAGIASGRLVRVFRGVYATSDPGLLPLARQTAALLSIGGGALLSHRSAAAIWRLVDATPATVDVSLVGREVRPRDGITLHRVNRLHPADIRTTSNLHLTAPARTLIDLAGQISRGDLQDAFGEARAKRRLTDKALDEALQRAPRNHAGAAIIRAMLHNDAGSTYTRSKAERALRRLLREADLPQPLVNVHLHGFTVDFLWPEQKLILEVDGYTTHGSRPAFERDRRRDQLHVAAGYVVIRITWDQLLHESLALIARIAQALARRAA